MEKIGEILSKNMPDSNEKFKKINCIVCKKEFDVPIWPFAEKISHTCKQICDECTEIDRKKREKEEFEKRIIMQRKNAEQYILREIPKKYQEIKSDRQDIINKYTNQSLFITGGAGVGKTVLMATMAKILIRELKELKWISYPAFIMELQSMFRKEPMRTEYGQRTPFDEADSLAHFEGWICIDDLGAEKLTDYVRQITYFIVNEREQRMLPLIITSNFSLAQIDEMIDSRISSRIAGICETIRLMGKDRRIKI